MIKRLFVVECEHYEAYASSFDKKTMEVIANGCCPNAKVFSYIKEDDDYGWLHAIREQAKNEEKERIKKIIDEHISWLRELGKNSEPMWSFCEEKIVSLETVKTNAGLDK